MTKEDCEIQGFTKNDEMEEDDFFSEILSSQCDIEEQVSELKEVLQSNQSDESKISEIQKFLSNFNILNCPVDILDEKIFNIALTAARDIYLKIIEDINNNSKNKNEVDQNLSKILLEKLINVLKCWTISIDKIKTLEKISIMEIKSFPENLLEVASRTISHCKFSIDFYGEKLDEIRESITLLFRQCILNLNSFFNLLDSKIIFNANENSDMKILITIVDKIGEIASNTNGMDFKTSSEMWKIFGKIATSHGIEIKTLSPYVITAHFQKLSENITTILSSVSENNQQSTNERTILCCRVLLKILEKLCETFFGWIKKEVSISFVKMLNNFFNYNDSYLSTAGYSAEFIKFIHTNLLFMVEPFLNVILKNDSFRMAFFEYEKNVQSDTLSFYLLILSILKKISKSGSDIQKDWCHEESSILNCTLENIDKISKDIYIGSIQVEICQDVGQGNYTSNIYECTFLSIIAIVCQTSESDFSKIEILFLNYLLKGGFFSTLLTSDVWCFICRLGSSDLCYNHFKFLVKVYQLFARRKNNLNVINLSNLIGRLYGILSDKDKQEFLNSIMEVPDLSLLDPIINLIGNEKKSILYKKIDYDTSKTSLINDLKLIEEPPYIENFHSFMYKLKVLRVTSTVYDQSICEVFVELWNKISNTIEYSEGTSLLILENLLTLLIYSTNPEFFDAKYISTILDSIANLYPYLSSRIRLEFVRFIHLQSPNFTTKSTEFLAKLFCLLIGDNDPWVQQSALECFENFTRLCFNENLVTSVAGNIRNANCSASKILPCYITGKKVYSLSGFTDIENFLKTVITETKHVCFKKIEREEKFLKTDISKEEFEEKSLDVNMKAEQICNDVENLMNFRSELKTENLEMLRNVFHKFFT